MNVFQTGMYARIEGAASRLCMIGYALLPEYPFNLYSKFEMPNHKNSPRIAQERAESSMESARPVHSLGSVISVSFATAKSRA